MANRCDECKEIRDDDQVYEFVGPVKIVLVDERQSTYIAKKCKASVILMAQILIGVTALPVLYYTLQYKQKDYMKALHVLLCTIGLQILLPFGILSLNILSGSTLTMQIEDRRLEHMLLIIVGVGCVIAGTTITDFAEYNPYYTVHCYIGICVTAVMCLTVLLGILFSGLKCGLYLPNLSICDQIKYSAHKTLGILTLLLSSVCFISGVMNIPMMQPELLYFCIASSAFYTFAILFGPIQGYGN